MQLNNFIIHHLIKEADTPAQLKLSQRQPEINEHTRALVGKLVDKYQERETYGRFEDGSINAFPMGATTYCTTNIGFLEFTHGAMTDLQRVTNLTRLSTGGYLLFADYVSNNDQYLSVFLVRNTDGFRFQDENEDVIDIRPNVHIDIEKLAMGCKLNKRRFIGAEGNYLSFIRTNRQETSQYFIEWISATELKKNSEYTNSLCDIIKRIELPTLINGENVDRDKLSKLTYEYCTNLPDRRVDLTELSKQLYGEENPNKIIDYATAQNIQIDTQFTPDRAKLRKLYKISIVSEDIKLSFDFNSLNSKIRINPDNPSMIIIESESLANQIREEIENSR